MARRFLFVILALAVAAATFALLRNSMVTKSTEAAKPAEVSAAPRILVAAADLSAGHFVQLGDMKWQDWPSNATPEGSIRLGDIDPSTLSGAVVRQGFVAGETINASRLVKPGDRGFMAAVLTPGARAVTVGLTPTSGNAGFVFPGDRVDVVLTVAVNDGPMEKTGERHGSETLLRNIRVLAVDQRADDQKKEVAVAKTATIEVTPKQAEIVALAGDIGKLSLSLRSLAGETKDGERAGEISVTWENEAVPHGRKAHATELQKIRIVRGVAATEIEFGNTTK